MKTFELKQQLQRIDSVFDRTQDACGDNVELLSHWAKYLCVLCAGFLENAVQILYSEFVISAASEPVQNFATSRLRRIQNPKTGLFIDLASSFKKSWGEELEAFVDEDGRREAIDSIMQNRHQIAHGEHSGITIVRVREYLKKSLAVIEFLEKQLKL